MYVHFNLLIYKKSVHQNMFPKISVIFMNKLSTIKSPYVPFFQCVFKISAALQLSVFRAVALTFADPLPAVATVTVSNFDNSYLFFYLHNVTSLLGNYRL